MSKKTFDAYVRRQIYLERLKKGEANILLRTISRSDQQVADIINRLPLKPNQRQLDKAINSITNIYTQRYDKVRENLINTSTRLTKNELRWMKRTLDVDIPDVDSIVSKSLDNHYQGESITTWANKLKQDKISRVKQTLKGSYESKGDRLIEFKKIQNITKHNTKTISNTFINHFTNTARNDVYETNDNINQVVWVSILDANTTRLCQVRSQKLYNADTHQPLGHSYSWGNGPGHIHFNCRSIAVPVDDPFEVQNYAPTYDEWLRTQPRSVVEEALGVNNAELFLTGGLTIAAFAVMEGTETTLEDEINEL